MRNYLKRLREKRGLSQQAVADQLAISRQYYQQIEAGERQQDMDTSIVVQLAKLFQTEPSRLIELETGEKQGQSPVSLAD